jgi:hypothetical protein
MLVVDSSAGCCETPLVVEVRLRWNSAQFTQFHWLLLMARDLLRKNHPHRYHHLWKAENVRALQVYPE